jgi:hypothetical protein
MVKMMSTINNIAHPRRIATETETSTGDVSVTLRNTTVLANYWLAFAATMVAILAMIIAGAMSNKVIIEMH